MNTPKKKKTGRRLAFGAPERADAALWMQVDVKRFVNGMVFGMLFASCVAAVNLWLMPHPIEPGAIGDIILIFAICIFYSMYLISFESRKVRHSRPILAVGATSLIPIVAAAVMPALGNPYLIPVTMASMIFGIVYSERTALGLSFMLCLLVGITYRTTNDAAIIAGTLPSTYNLVLVLFGGAAAAALGCGQIRKRSKLLKVGLIASLVQMSLIVGVRLRGGELLRHEDLLGFFNGIGSAALITAILPIIEHIFKTTTDISLLELSDQNHSLLRRLSIEAPGTYHHSLILGNIAEAAGASIDANSLLLRVASYFHDVGKILKPEYFVENEALQGSMHTNLSPTMSALIITAHSRDGVELAQEKGVPDAITQLIQEHHGTSLVEFFYRQAKEAAGDRERINEEMFRHPGPKPQSREAGVLMLADSVESASRTLPDPTPQRVARMVHELISRKLFDGQLDECELTLAELHRVEQALVRSISSVFHGRIKYPEPEEAPPRERNGR